MKKYGKFYGVNRGKGDPFENTADWDWRRGRYKKKFKFTIAVQPFSEILRQPELPQNAEQAKGRYSF